MMKGNHIICDQQFQVLDWVARSPDLNILENTLNIFTRKMYTNSCKIILNSEGNEDVGCNIRRTKY